MILTSKRAGADFQAFGRSRGGRGTKIHLVTDGAGRVLSFIVTPRQMGDMRPAHGLLACLPPPDTLLADAAHDSNGLRAFFAERGTTPVIPNNPTRKRFHPFDRAAYRPRTAIERTFIRLKDWRRIHTR